MKNTKYTGWANVPEGVLVRTKTKYESALKTRYEYYIKLDGDKFAVQIGADRFDLAREDAWDPDDFTTGKYREVELK